MSVMRAVGWARGPAAVGRDETIRRGEAPPAWSRTKRLSGGAPLRSGGGLSIPTARSRRSIYAAPAGGRLPLVKPLPTTRAREQSTDGARTPQRQGAVRL